MEPGIKKLTEAVKRDCREGQGCFNPNGCDHEFLPVNVFKMADVPGENKHTD